MKKTIYFLYQFFRSLRYSIISTHFGVVSHCSHTPTCGTVTLKTLQEKGIIQASKAFVSKVGRCW